MKRIGSLAAVICAVVALAATSCAQETTAPPNIPQFKPIYSATTLTCPPNAIYADVFLFGASGGGGGGYSASAGGGGANGAVIRCLFKCANGAITVTPGGPGLGAPAGTSACTTPTAGGDTVAVQGASSCIAHGGQAGSGIACNGGNTATALATPPISAIQSVNGSIGTAGANGVPGTSGALGIPGGFGGNNSQPGNPGTPGFATAAFF